MSRVIGRVQFGQKFFKLRWIEPRRLLLSDGQRHLSHRGCVEEHTQGNVHLKCGHDAADNAHSLE